MGFKAFFFRHAFNDRLIRKYGNLHRKLTFELTFFSPFINPPWIHCLETHRSPTSNIKRHYVTRQELRVTFEGRGWPLGTNLFFSFFRWPCQVVVTVTGGDRRVFADAEGDRRVSRWQPVKARTRVPWPCTRSSWWAVAVWASPPSRSSSCMTRWAQVKMSF